MVTDAAPTLELLAWVHERERTYAETIDVWSTRCPRLAVWEDSLATGLVAMAPGARVVLTAAGRALLG
jgi:hypothetical protein